MPSHMTSGSLSDGKMSMPVDTTSSKFNIAPSVTAGTALRRRCGVGLKSDRPSAVKHLREHVEFAPLVRDQLWCVSSELRTVRTGGPFSTSLASSISVVADRPVNVAQMWGQINAHRIDSIVTKWLFEMMGKMPITNGIPRRQSRISRRGLYPNITRYCPTAVLYMSEPCQHPSAVR